MHIALPVGKENILMGTDALESMGHKLTEGNNFHLSVDANNEEEQKNPLNPFLTGERYGFH